MLAHLFKHLYCWHVVLSHLHCRSIFFFLVWIIFGVAKNRLHLQQYCFLEALWLPLQINSLKAQCYFNQNSLFKTWILECLKRITIRFRSNFESAYYFYPLNLTKNNCSKFSSKIPSGCSLKHLMKVNPRSCAQLRIVSLVVRSRIFKSTFL
jgi:hypothetical protein